MSHAMDEVSPVEPSTLQRAVSRCLSRPVGNAANGDAPPVAEGAALRLRLFCLMQLLTARRIQALIAAQGDPVLVVACEVAAGMRLNARWGFNQQKMLAAIRARIGA